MFKTAKFKIYNFIKAWLNFKKYFDNRQNWKEKKYDAHFNFTNTCSYRSRRGQN